ncbi:alpha/beta fold hydrolase [Ahrensia sp. R2A130]|uniref:alpha/beta fold hydrolase n=1 Tax=Ahrensia sp. R2A130 TaxID=744979 RepID=UPI0001E0CA03|nr:alpha/beta hydrolase [Ahrensia sp. R2A130]EFL88815.1 alpha/beta hydrolase fold protein [Ahrensia sp. R2A130]
MTIFILLLLVVGGAAFGYTRFQAERIEAQYPPAGEFADVAGVRLHYLDVPAEASEKPPVVFLHGASGNLHDQRGAFEAKLKGSRRMLFIDRPGHGYSQRGEAETPAQQADLIAGLLDQLGIERAVIVGHSLGSASTAALGVLHPEKVQGLVFLAPATHVWPGGVTWYYSIAALPVIGNMFTETLSLPVGMTALETGTKSVFDPNAVPQGYVENAAIPVFLRPSVFRANARDVAGLKGFVTEFSKRYSEIKAPTVIITGDTDDIVAPSIHSIGLERDIEGAELIILPGVGHKPDYVATDRIIQAIDKVSFAKPVLTN